VTTSPAAYGAGCSTNLNKIGICETDSRDSIDCEETASQSRSHHRDSLRVLSCDWAGYAHDRSREDRGSCHSGNSQCAIAPTECS